uniref:14-3-3 domain-containing protein n=1 Tax=Ananas comosus var. bracteatus TaxID=296719 RepID=A0A6V7PEU3_ANACO|nr:unnamed protein product [Ananas comosus var. bracteatus]
MYLHPYQPWRPPLAHRGRRTPPRLFRASPCLRCAPQRRRPPQPRGPRSEDGVAPRFLTDPGDHHSPIAAADLRRVSREIASAVHQIILNGAALRRMVSHPQALGELQEVDVLVLFVLPKCIGDLFDAVSKLNQHQTKIELKRKLRRDLLIIGACSNQGSAEKAWNLKRWRPSCREGAAERPAVVPRQLWIGGGALQNAPRLVRSGGRPADINSELSAASTDSFDEFPDADGSPLANMQTNLSRLVSNSLNLSTVNSKIFYLKIKSDYHRYLAEFKVGAKRKEAAENTLVAYKAVQDIALTELARTNHAYQLFDEMPKM